MELWKIHNILVPFSRAVPGNPCQADSGLSSRWSLLVLCEEPGPADWPLERPLECRAPPQKGTPTQKGLLASCSGLHSGPAVKFVGQMQDENAGPLVQNVLKSSKQQQQSTEPSVGPFEAQGLGTCTRQPGWPCLRREMKSEKYLNWLWMALEATAGTLDVTPSIIGNHHRFEQGSSVAWLLPEGSLTHMKVNLRRPGVKIKRPGR